MEPRLNNVALAEPSSYQGYYD